MNAIWLTLVIINLSNQRASRDRDQDLPSTAQATSRPSPDKATSLMPLFHSAADFRSARFQMNFTELADCVPCARGHAVDRMSGNFGFGNGLPSAAAKLLDPARSARLSATRILPSARSHTVQTHSCLEDPGNLLRSQGSKRTCCPARRQNHAWYRQ
jgi:hypothetical protein